MTRVLHPRVELVQKKPDFFRRSDHSQYGFLAASGPSIQNQGALDDFELLNLAPTFLSLMGAPIPDRMTGQVIEFLMNG
jgi:predicted AlkP superfamily phosphohydrolase/phosphomutase